MHGSIFQIKRADIINESTRQSEDYPHLFLYTQGVLLITYLTHT